MTSDQTNRTSKTSKKFANTFPRTIEAYSTIRNKKVRENWGNLAITSPTQAAKALQAKVLGNERSDLLSATIFDPEMANQRERI